MTDHPLVYKIQAAIMRAPRVFYRHNPAMDLPHEVCREGIGSEPEIVVMGSCHREDGVDAMLRECGALLKARAVFEAISSPVHPLTPTRLGDILPK